MRSAGSIERVTFTRVLLVLLVAANLGQLVNLLSQSPLPLVRMAGQDGGIVLRVEEAHILFRARKAVFVHAGTPEEFLRSRIPGAKLVSFSDEVLKPLTRQRAVVYCSSSCSAAKRVALQLRDRGCKRVDFLRGGLRAWRRAGLPTQQGEPAEAAP